MGNCYNEGVGVEQDLSEAVKWFRLAAEQGYAPAQFNLGASYNNGEGVAENKDEAIKWFRLAAEQGDEDAIDTLIDMGEWNDD